MQWVPYLPAFCDDTGGVSGCFWDTILESILEDTTLPAVSVLYDGGLPPFLPPRALYVLEHRGATATSRWATSCMGGLWDWNSCGGPAITISPAGACLPAWASAVPLGAMPGWEVGGLGLHRFLRSVHSCSCNSVHV